MPPNSQPAKPTHGGTAASPTMAATKKKKMKYINIILITILNLTSLHGQSKNEYIVTSDIDNFWIAYDKVQTTNDSTLQLNFLNTHFFERGSEGLPLIMEARRYTPQEYLTAIITYPLFWESIRKNTLMAKGYAEEIEQGVEKLKAIYPNIKPAKIYFTIGALRTPGTALNGKLLIGSELAMADANTNTSEFTTKFTHLKPYFANNPINDIVFLNIHEYIHTQQKTEGGYDLLSQSLFEGIAEFIPVIALGTASPTPAINFGKINEQQVKEIFEKEMFSPWIYNWIWNDFDNEFKTRDLGYYIGYAIAEKYFNNSKNKSLAIQELIELDFNCPELVEALVDKSGYFSKSTKALKKKFEKSRPAVIGIKQLKNGDKNINPNITQITIEFSTSMDKRFRSTDYGKLGKDFFPEIVSAKFADDGKSITYEIRLKPNQKYQFVIERSFRTEKAIPLKPYVLEFTTSINQ